MTKHFKQIHHLRKNKAVFEPAMERAKAKFGSFQDTRAELESVLPTHQNNAETVLEAIANDRVEALATNEDFRTAGLLEAIILADLRPPYFITNDQIVIAGNYDQIDLLNSHKADLETEATKVGRVDLFNHRLPYAGTGWLIDDDIVVTNRHVANVFATMLMNGDYEMRLGRFGQPLRIEANQYHQFQTSQPNDYDPMRVKEVLYIANSQEPDFAFLRVSNPLGLEPIELSSTRVEIDQPIAAIGYPASDATRNDAALMHDLFGGIYNVKRFSPGICTGYSPDGLNIFTDYTSTGGSSGSVVLSIETKKAVALHFAGVFEETNYAVPADIVGAALRKVREIKPSAWPEAVPAQSSSAESFSDRLGYDPDFLGSGEFRVGYPNLGEWSEDVAPVSDDEEGILKYTHFSVIQSKSRRLPMLTAVNIDGEKAFKLKRKGRWRLDGRLASEHQIGNELYRHNPLDRGHMVRRMDPGWGESREEAQQAEIDTFHYTNSAPQHKWLNQRDWLGLEDYLLESAHTRGFKLSIMTGPVFLDTDKSLRHQPGAEDIPIPEHFWKVAIMINDERNELSATGYLLTQGELIRDLTEAAFILGDYKLYQVKLSRIRNLTGLDFSDLEIYDPLKAEPEGLFGRSAIEVTSFDTIRL